MQTMNWVPFMNGRLTALISFPLVKEVEEVYILLPTVPLLPMNASFTKNLYISTDLSILSFSFLRKRIEKEGIEKENVHGCIRRSWFCTTKRNSDWSKLELSRT
jgi:hypothetical protein